jgi:periplasmic protein TonB
MSAAMMEGRSFGGPLAASVVLHAALAATLLLARTGERPPSPPTYRVSLVAAPPGPRQVGVVQPAPSAPIPAPTPAPIAREVPTSAKKAPTKAKPTPQPKIATPNATPNAAAAPKAVQPVAGGGPQGGRGADVANVQVDGTVFPYPAYLANIVRQIAVQFKPTARGALTAEVAFIIRRDGSIAGLRLTRRSSVYSFDQDALAAVELASKSFGPLPAEFSDDALPVIFTFDPRIIR